MATHMRPTDLRLEFEPPFVKISLPDVPLQGAPTIFVEGPECFWTLGSRHSNEMK